MQTVKLELPVDAAKQMLRDFEARLQERQGQRVLLDSEINSLEASVQALRSQLNGHAPSPEQARAGRGSNKQTIVDFLQKVGAARPIDIHRGTGIAKSSVPFVLKGNPKTFECDGSGFWRVIGFGLM